MTPDIEKLSQSRRDLLRRLVRRGYVWLGNREGFAADLVSVGLAQWNPLHPELACLNPTNAALSSERREGP